MAGIRQPSARALSLARAFSRRDVAAFAALSGDSNPLHSQDDKAIVPGLLLASLFPAIIGSTFPGSLYLSQLLKFRQSALVDEEVVAEVRLLRSSGRRARFATACVGASGGVLVSGEALALVPTAALQRVFGSTLSQSSEEQAPLPADTGT